MVRTSGGEVARLRHASPAAWAPRRTFDLFGPWWELAETGRNLPGCAATLAKSIINATWGRLYCINGDQRAEVRWSDQEGGSAL